MGQPAQRMISWSDGQQHGLAVAKAVALFSSKKF
jgi:hypothetical protein